MTYLRPDVLMMSTQRDSTRRWPTAIEWERIRRDIDERCLEVLNFELEKPEDQLEDNENRKAQWKYLRRGCTERQLYGSDLKKKYEGYHGAH